MEPLKIAATKSTPSVEFNIDSGLLTISGESYPEYAAKFYSPVISWIKKYIEESNKPIVLNIELNYLNTSSIRYMRILFERLNDGFLSGKDITLNWHYDRENDVALSIGEELAEDLKIPFHLVES